MMTAELATETNFGGAFRTFVKGEKNAELRALRERAFGIFSRKGFPTQKDEDWKYTNVSSVGSETWLVNSESVDFSGVALGLIERFNFERNGFTALNMAFAEIKVVRITKELVVEEPIAIDLISKVGEAIFPHVVVVAEPGSQATIVETYGSSAAGFTNAAICIAVGDNANVTHYRIQKESADAVHYGVTEVSIGRGGVYNSTNITLGGAISRHDIEVRFTDEGGEAFVDGLYMLNGSQHHDTHSILDHGRPNCTSHQTYKGVLNDKSRAVFNGKVFVRENASGTDAQQSNKNLLLSNEARVDTKPQLKFADVWICRGDHSQDRYRIDKEQFRRSGA
ncbi:MAG: SufD family Fe-S cluster assembly protein [Acidobacteria bacterium]|nr:SufD family Fe-S cluster assembly protein [Acidobacteriota bacterium]